MQGAKILKWAYNNEQGAKLISDIIQASAKNDGGAIRSTLLAFDKFLRKNEAAIKRQVGEAATLQPQQA
jgi:predicted outer membrane repeat protein